jgi:hypothetical protein
VTPVFILYSNEYLHSWRRLDISAEKKTMKLFLNDIAGIGIFPNKESNWIPT